MTKQQIFHESCCGWFFFSSQIIKKNVSNFKIKAMLLFMFFTLWQQVHSTSWSIPIRIWRSLSSGRSLVLSLLTNQRRFGFAHSPHPSIRSTVWWPTKGQTPCNHIFFCPLSFAFSVYFLYIVFMSPKQISHLLRVLWLYLWKIKKTILV